jgi:hypothetical protein
LNIIEPLWSVLETEWGTDSHLQHLWSNLKMFFKKNGIKFARDCSKGLRLYWRQRGVLIKKYIQCL